MIPKSFTLVNKKWLVRRVTNAQFQKHLDIHWNSDAPKESRLKADGLKGLCEPSICRIFLNKDCHRAEEDLEFTFWHEFVHALKFANGEDEHDEKEVDRLGSFLHQFEQTRKEIS